MVMELCLLAPLGVLYWNGYLPIKYCVGIMLFIYWLPKFFFVRLLETSYPQVVTRLINSKNTNYVALTFDDAPYGSHRQIIEKLDQYQMKGTFYIVSGQVTKNDFDSLVKAVQNGHQLGNHGKTNSMHFLKNKNDLTEEIKHCDQMIKDIYQAANMPLPKKMYYRPGCGMFGPEILEIAKKLGYELALGSVYPNDPTIIFSYINYLYIINHIEVGDVVITHDRSWTPNMLDKLLVWLEQHHMKSVTMNTLFTEN